MLTFTMTEAQAEIVRTALTEYHDDVIGVIPDIRNDEGDQAANDHATYAAEIYAVLDVLAPTQA
jgi:hypothetical protein